MNRRSTYMFVFSLFYQAVMARESRQRQSTVVLSSPLLVRRYPPCTESTSDLRLFCTQERVRIPSWDCTKRPQRVPESLSLMGCRETRRAQHSLYQDNVRLSQVLTVAP